MLSENTTKLIRSLVHKKYRYKHNNFIVEGKKAILDMLSAGYSDIEQIYVTQVALDENLKTLSKVRGKLTVLTDKTIAKISNMESAPDMILIGKIPQPMPSLLSPEQSGIHLYLDQVQDPGNVGTMIRTAEWFGISSIGMSEGTADIVHPKVIQASMGSFSRMPYWYGQITTENIPAHLTVLGADLTGDSIYETELPDQGILVIGNEGQGISVEIKKVIKKFIRIPGYSPYVESLNAANATAIILSEWQRQIHVRRLVQIKKSI